MALSESIEYDKIEVVGQYKSVQVRKAMVIKKDGVELTRTYQRYVLSPGELDASDNLVDNPLLKEPDGTTDIPDEVKSICTAAWTTTIKNAWKANLIATKR
tara:strand:+ start:483 stop:785 length:303 start_codon:yes stop_codon:yes gene_type:complete